LSQIEFITILQIALGLILKLSGPVLFATMTVGLSVGTFQSVTQVQEATLTFVPKIIAGITTIMALAPWMIDTFITTTNELFKYLIVSPK
jgi:flagellar biosynthetic protein FliQ